MNNNIKEITEKLEKGVKDVFESDKYKEYLDFMCKFHTYSVNNIMLIMLQKPEASLVAGYKAWQTKFGRQVRKGEKGITIIRPCPHKKEVEDEEGNVTETKFWTTFSTCKVFDVSQTEGADLPSGCVTKLTGEVDDFEELVEKLRKVSPVEVDFEDIKGEANGFFSPVEQRIAIQEGMSEQQTIKTMVHEIAHSMLHDKDCEESEADRNTREVQAESVAYTVCNMLGLDTSDYSFGYVAGWSKGKEAKELSESMEIIRKTAMLIVDGLAA